MSKSDKFTIQLNKLRQERRLLFIFIFFLAAIFVWVFSSIFSTRQDKKISAELVKLAEPLVPSLDQTVLERVANKTIFAKEDLARFPIYALIQSELGDLKVVDVLNQTELVVNTLSPEADPEGLDSQSPTASSSTTATSSTELSIN